MQLLTIISGAQTGADRAGIDAAIAQPLYKWGGWVPKGRLAEDGTIPDSYFGNLKECEDSRYPRRTALNLRQCDASLIFNFGRRFSRGTKLTLTLSRKFEKDYKIIDPSSYHSVLEVVKWLLTYRNENGKSIDVLNIAGSRESKCPGIYAATRTYMDSLLSQYFLARRYNLWQ